MAREARLRSRATQQAEPLSFTNRVCNDDCGTSSNPTKVRHQLVVSWSAHPSRQIEQQHDVLSLLL